MLLTAYEISILNTEFSPWSFSSSISSHQQIDCKPEKVNHKFTRALSEIHFLKEGKLKYQRNQKAQQTNLHVIINVLHLKLTIKRRWAGIRYNNTVYLILVNYCEITGVLESSRTSTMERNVNSDISIATMHRVLVIFFELGVVKDFMQKF